LFTALRTCDRELSALTEYADDLRLRELELEERLAEMRAGRQTCQQAIDAKTDEFDAKAEAAQFPGKPTYQLRLQPSLPQAFRYERSLLPSINATEADVARRRTFEEAIA